MFGMDVLEIRTEQAGDENLALLVENEECLWGQRAFEDFCRDLSPH
jgi:hypothetical protein